MVHSWFELELSCLVFRESPLEPPNLVSGVGCVERDVLEGLADSPVTEQQLGLFVLRQLHDDGLVLLLHNDLVDVLRKCLEGQEVLDIV